MADGIENAFIGVRFIAMPYPTLVPTSTHAVFLWCTPSATNVKTTSDVIGDPVSKNIDVCNNIVKIATFNILLKLCTLELAKDIKTFISEMQEGPTVLFDIMREFKSLDKEQMGKVVTFKEIVVGTTDIETKQRIIMDKLISKNANKNVEIFFKRIELDLNRDLQELEMLKELRKLKKNVDELISNNAKKNAEIFFTANQLKRKREED
jgi:hypothetical protein